MVPETPSLQFSQAGHVATIVLDRQQALNAIDPETGAALVACFERIASDDSIRAVVLTGAGERAFSAGADLKKTAEVTGPYAAQAFAGGGDNSFASALDCEKPLIAAIEFISFMVRPFSLGLRLFVAMIAGHILMEVFGSFIVSGFSGGPMGWGVGALSFLFIIFVSALELLVAAIQAYVFALLTTLYLNDAVNLH